MPAKLNLVGHKYGRLLVLSEESKWGRCYYWNCVCTCGKKVVVQTGNLRSGHTRSCGCLHKESIAAMAKVVNSTHGLSNTPEYRTYKAMLQRCTDKNHQGWIYYGGRGITICDRWLESFENFLADMGTRPTEGYSLDRIDSNGNYCKENCRWATQTEQNNNTNGAYHYLQERREYMKQKNAEFWRNHTWLTKPILKKEDK